MILRRLASLAVLLSACSRHHRNDPESDYYSCTTRVVGLSAKELDARGRNEPFATAHSDLARQTIRAHQNEISACYQTALERLGLRVGRIDVRYAIDAQGKVVRAAVEHNDTGADELACCVVDRLLSWRFPEGPQTGVAEFREPFNFNPGNPFAAAATANAAEFKRFQDTYGNCQESPEDRAWREKRLAEERERQAKRAQQGQLPAQDEVESHGCESVPAGYTCGSLPKAAIRGVIQSHIEEVRSCYVTALLAQPKLQGRSQVLFVIEPDGHVSRSLTEQSTLNTPALDCCIARHVATWQFPPPDGGGIVIVSYPFALENAGNP